MSEPGATTERDMLRRVMPRPEEDAADELADALAHSRFRAERFGKQIDVKVDRYIVRRELGRGGMGVVFEAYDPVLMVPVALKVLRQVSEPGSANDADLRLQREAQALASVEGDHVVRVYSAGFFKRQPWIAMQFIAGPDLATWLRYRRDRGTLAWPELLAKFVDAARGLIAVHLAGLIHRDFKPQNAVVDPRGRVRVLDFGLATHDRRPMTLARPIEDLRGYSLNSTGALVGTARYAAPEQFTGKDLDHRSDQFSFCVALYEALFATLPFGDTVSTGQHLAAGGAPVTRPAASDVPGWLTAAVLRGLAPDRGDRFPDMPALLHELTRDRRRASRRAALILGGGLLGGLAAAASLYTPNRASLCAAHASDIEPLADLAHVPVAAAPVLERWLAAWKSSYRVACVETYSLARAPETTLAHRHECLASERMRVTALLGRAAAADDPDALTIALLELPPPTNCLAEGLGRVAAPYDPKTRQQVQAVDMALANAYAERMFGDYAAATELAGHAVASAAASGHRPALARAHFALGELERLRQRPATAALALDAAAAEAALVDDIPLVVRAEHELVRLALLAGHVPDSADGHLQRAATTLAALVPERLGERQAARFTVDYLWAEHADMRGLSLYHARDYDAAINAHTDALARWTALAGQADLRRELAASRIDRGRAYSDAQRPDAALHDAREGLRLETTLLGPDHPSLAINHFNIATDLRIVADLDGALAAARRSLQLNTLHHGARSAQAASDYTLLAAIHQDRGELGLARDYARAAVAAHAGTHSPDSARADASYALAGIALLEDASDADTLLRQAAAAYRRIPGPEAACQQALAHVYCGLYASWHHRLDDVERATSAAEVALGEVDGDACEATGQLLWLRGNLAADRGRPREAATLLTAALDATPEPAPARADMLVDLARVEHERGADRARIESLVRPAQQIYRARGRVDLVVELDEFLQASPRAPSPQPPQNAKAPP